MIPDRRVVWRCKMVRIEVEMVFETDEGEKVNFVMTFMGRDYSDAYEDSILFVRNQMSLHDWVLIGGRVLSVIDTRN
jgi:hypothetical protein